MWGPYIASYDINAGFTAYKVPEDGVRRIMDLMVRNNGEFCDSWEVKIVKAKKNPLIKKKIPEPESCYYVTFRPRFGTISGDYCEALEDVHDLEDAYYSLKNILVGLLGKEL